MPREIPLTRGRVALVDDEDYIRLSPYKWYATTAGYAATRSDPDHPGRHHYMHRVIMQARRGQIVDHINGDTLDNRRANLRFVTQTQNLQNSRPNRRTRSGYKGVNWNKVHGWWEACIQVNGVRHHLGTFDDPLIAAKAYDAAARTFFGPYAWPNFPDE